VEKRVKGEGPIENKTSKTHKEDQVVSPFEERDATDSAAPSIKTRIVLGLVAAAVCVCVVVFGPGLAELVKQQGQAGTIEKDGIAPVVVTNTDGAKQDGEIAQQDDTETLTTKDLNPADPVGLGDESDADQNVQPGQVPISEEERLSSQAMLQQLISDNYAKIQKKESELIEMQAMLDLLLEIGDDPDRVSLYKNLITDTKAEVQDIKNKTLRYENELTKE
jgi:hypothetical protein